MTPNKSIIQEVKNELSIEDDLSSNELYDLLYKYRNGQHPDKYTDEELKKEAEERFKNLNALLDKLSKYIELEKRQKKPSEVIPFQKDYEAVSLKQEIILLQRKIDELNSTIKSRDSRIKTLELRLSKYRDKKQAETINELIKLYEPSKKDKWRNGIIVLLVFIYAVFTQSEKVVEILAKYSPLSPWLLNTIVFGLFSLVIIGLLKKYFESEYIKKLSKRIVTPNSVSSFYQTLPQPDENRIHYFEEIDVYKYIGNELNKKFEMWKLFAKYFSSINDEITINYLKDIFILNLYNKQLIEIAGPNKLDQRFSIKSGYYYF